MSENHRRDATFVRKLPWTKKNRKEDHRVSFPLRAALRVLEVSSSDTKVVSRKGKVTRMRPTALTTQPRHLVCGQTKPHSHRMAFLMFIMNTSAHFKITMLLMRKVNKFVLQKR